jgi:hypothetical protein
MGVQAIDTAVAGDEPASIRDGLAPFMAVLDETVVRAITAEETVDAYVELLKAAAPS